MRLFVAVNLPEAERARVAAATAPLRAASLPVRWVEADAYHITLKFLGQVQEEQAPAIRAAVQDVAARQPRFTLELRGAGAFPSARRPSVWWIGLGPSDALAALRASVEAAIAPLGFPTEARPFAPHLTLGRTRREGAPIRDAERLLQGIALHCTFRVDTLDLMRSHLSPRGARYERVLAAELAS